MLCIATPNTKPSAGNSPSCSTATTAPGGSAQNGCMSKMDREPKSKMRCDQWHQKEISAANGVYMRQAAAIFLVILFLLLSSCAGFRLPPEESTDNRPRIPGSGDVGM